jgi:phospholipid/cholesterol/gamma-HCH transport system substrate-binding protein
MRRRGRRGLSPLAVGVLFIIITGVVAYFAFTKANPFASPFEVKAVFSNALNIRPNSPVRIAGVNVGKVNGVERKGDTDYSVVTMEIEDIGLPIRKDAVMKIRPRLFLEGNWFVDVSPGTPSSPELESGDDIPVTQTATPVQLDEVLTSLQYDQRTNLQLVIQSAGSALTSLPTPAQDADQDPSVRGDTAARALNDTLEYAPEAERDAARVNQALLGTDPGTDVPRLIQNFGRVMGALRSREVQLQGLITSFNDTNAALASESAALQQSIRDLPPTLVQANETFASLNASFPPTRAFAREALPGVRELGPTIDASFPFIRQTRLLFQPDELRGLAQELRATIPPTADAADEALKLLPQANLAARCAAEVVLPTGDIVIQDPPHTTGVENYKEFMYAMVGLAGEGQIFDGNGMFVRFSTGGGDLVIGTGATLGTASDRLFGTGVRRPIGTRPRRPSRTPPFNSSVPCYKSQIPVLNGPQVDGPPDGIVSGGIPGTEQFESQAEDKLAEQKAEAEALDQAGEANSGEATEDQAAEPQAVQREAGDEGGFFTDAPAQDEGDSEVGG